MTNTRTFNPYVVKRRTTRLVVSLFKLLFLFGLCYLFLFPLFYILVAAFQDPNVAKDPTVVWIPNAFSFDNFKLAVQLMNYSKSIVMTLAITLLSTLATLLSCSLVGYGLARFDFIEKKVVFLVVVLLIIVPPTTTMFSSYLNFRYFNPLGVIGLLSPLTGKSSINLLNTIWVFVLPALTASGLRSGLFIFIFRQFFAGQPKELEEAAKIDGCNAFYTYFRIMVPLAVPAFITVMLFSFIWHWNENYISFLYFPKVIKPISVQLNVMRNTFLADSANVTYSPTAMRGALGAGALISIAPSLLLYLFTQKYFTESVERAGIVG